MRVRVSLLAALTAAALAPAACTLPPSGDYNCHVTYATTGPSSAAGSAACTPVTTPATPTTSPTTAPTTGPSTTSPTSPAPSPSASPSPSPSSSPIIAWPGPGNTGVPAGTALSAYTGPCSVTTANTVIDAKVVDCDLVIFAANVTVTRSKINGGIWLDTDRSGADGWSVKLYDSEVDKGVQQIAAVCCGNMDVRRSNVHGGQTAVQCEEVSLACHVSDSWLHGQQLPDTANWHLGGFLSDGTRGAGCTGTWCIELVHNTVVCDHAVNSLGEGCTGDVNLIPNFAPISKVRVYGNLLGANVGSAYCTFGGEKSTSPYPHADHVTYDGNVFQRGSNARCAAYGPVTDFRATGTGNVWTGNAYDDGATIPAP